ncbi:nitroreductase family protein [Oceanobacillus sp. M65]|uniref:nitroreductase family protein n=1 Tax=Oceanobacillus sp. M65 TaxID=3457435 RepID=UPI003FCCA8DA
MPSLEQFQHIQAMIEENHQILVQDHDVKENTQKLNLNISYPNKRKLLQSALEERTATRFYNLKPIELSHLLTILGTVKQLDLENWSTPNQLGVNIDISIIIRNVTDVHSPAIYDYDVVSDTLLPVYEIPEDEDKDAWYLQKEFTNSPAVIIVHGTLENALKQFGEHGYRHLLTRGGVAVQNAWLSALTLGYSGSIFAGTLPKPLKKFTNIDGYKKVQLCAFSFGSNV